MVLNLGKEYIPLAMELFMKETLKMISHNKV